jgi:hypothetical protein
MATVVDIFTRLQFARSRVLTLARADGHGEALPIGVDIWRPSGQRHAYAVGASEGGDPCVLRLEPAEADARHLEFLRSEYSRFIRDAEQHEEKALGFDLAGRMKDAGARRQMAASSRRSASRLLEKEPTLRFALGAA